MVVELFNEEDIRKTYKFLNHQQETEIRLIDPKKQKTPRSIFVKSEKEFKNVCIQYAGEYNIYVGINERKEHGTTKQDVISVQTIVIDVDPKREPGTSSTNEELKKAEEVADKIKEYLKEKGIIAYKAMSGNGYHLWIPTPLYKIDDKTRDKSEIALQNLFRFLQKKFNTDDVKIDNIGDLPRIIKVIGTISIKGENTRERPWRISKWIDEPKRVENKNIEKLLEEANKQEKKEKNEENKKIGSKKLEIILNFDKKLKKLLNGEMDKKYETRSEKEMAIVTKLCSYDFTFDEIDEIMNAYGLEKWAQAPKQYKELTYNKAKEFSEKIPKNALAEYLSLNIQAVLIYPNKDDSITKIITDHGAIELTTQELINPNKFKTSYYFLSGGHMLQPINTGVWARILTYWTKEKGRIMTPDKSTEEEIIKEKIINEIEGFVKVDKIEDTLFYGRVFQEDGSYLVPSSTIEMILKKHKINTKLTKVAYWLQDYLSRPSKTKRVNKKVIRFWYFKTDKIHLEEDNYLEIEEDDEDD